jgi:intracellular multiplication protein IcmL
MVYDNMTESRTMSENAFYKANHRHVLGAVVLLLFTSLFLIMVMFYQIANPPQADCFAAVEDGTEKPIYPLSQPLMPPSEILQWAARVAEATHNYDFLRYRETLGLLQGRFTKDGWGSFTSALNDSKALDEVISKKLMLTAVVRDTPVMLTRGVVNGRYAWKVQIPLLITYQSASEQSQQRTVVEMVITRVPTTDAPLGIAVVSFTSNIL